jgi:hypothetical protein
MKVRIMLCSLFVLLAASRVFADWCVGTSSVAGTNQHYRVDGQFDHEGQKWSYVFTDLKTGEKRTGPLPRIGSHAHLYFFLSQDGKRFAVLDSGADTHLENRFMVFTAEGKLISSLGINDILTKDEQAEVRPSISHICWIGTVCQFDSDMKIVAESYGRYLPNANAVGLTTLSEREVLISLTDGKVIRKDK